jgi:hypothetical protein
MIENIVDRRWGRPVDPTPFEIAVATARIRMGWSEAEHRQRAGLPECHSWEPPTGRIEEARFLMDGMRE